MKRLIRMLAVIAVIWALCYTVIILFLLGESLLVTLSGKPLPNRQSRSRGQPYPFLQNISSLLGNTIRNITNFLQSMCQPSL